MISGVICWFDRMESCMALSTAEEKDVATCDLGGSMFLLKTTIWFDWYDLHFGMMQRGQWSSSLWCRSRSLERGSSSIAGETGCLSINLDEARRLLRCKWSSRFSLDVIGPSKAHKLSLDVISHDVILCYKLPEWSLSTSGRILVFSRSRFLPKTSDDFMSPSDMVRGLVPSMVRCKCCALPTWW